MKAITLVDFRSNPDLRIAIESAARRERARQIVLFVKSLFEKGPRHAARTRLSHQG